MHENVMEKDIDNENELEQKSNGESNVSFKNILRITYPVVLSMLSLNIMQFVDRAFVANSSLTQFSATMPSSFLANSIASIFLGITGYVATLVSQYYGANKHKNCSSTMWQGVYLGMIFSVVLLVLSPFASNIFSIMGHTGELLKYEKSYFYLVIFACCAQLFSTAFSGFFTGIGNTKITMYVAVITNVVNIVLDWVFIFGKFGFPKMGGIMGAGTATIISCIIGALIYLVVLRRNNKKDEYEIFNNRKIDKVLIKKLLKYGFPAGIQSFVGMGYVSILLLIIGKSGEFNLACSNIAFTIEGISIFPVWGIGTAVSIITGQERGGNRIANIPKALKNGIIIGICFNAILIVLFNFFPELLISIFNSGYEEEKFSKIMDYTIPLIRITSVWLLFDTIQIIIGNVLRSVGDTMFMMVIYLIMPFLFYIVIPVISIFLGFSLFWIWIELLVYTLCMLTMLTIRFYSNKWKRINVI